MPRQAKVALAIAVNSAGTLRSDRSASRRGRKELVVVLPPLLGHLRQLLLGPGLTADQRGAMAERVADAGVAATWHGRMPQAVPELPAGLGTEGVASVSGPRRARPGRHCRTSGRSR